MTTHAPPKHNCHLPRLSHRLPNTSPSWVHYCSSSCTRHSDLTHYCMCDCASQHRCHPSRSCFNPCLPGLTVAPLPTSNLACHRPPKLRPTIISPDHMRRPRHAHTPYNITHHCPETHCRLPDCTFVGRTVNPIAHMFDPARCHLRLTSSTLVAPSLSAPASPFPTMSSSPLFKITLPINEKGEGSSCK